MDERWNERADRSSLAFTYLTKFLIVLVCHVGIDTLRRRVALAVRAFIEYLTNDVIHRRSSAWNRNPARVPFWPATKLVWKAAVGDNRNEL